MASVATVAPTLKERKSAVGRSLYEERSQFWWQIVTGATVLAYLASLAFIHRPLDGYSSFWDGWVGNIACTVPIVPLLLRARHSTKLRTAWLALAGGVALNDIGYQGPLSVEWEDSRMDREHGAKEAAAFVKKIDFKPSSIAFDAQFDR